MPTRPVADSEPSAGYRLLRSSLAFLACPGMVAWVIPGTWMLADGGFELRHPAGLIPMTAGLAALLWSVRDFHVAGRGTLAPWDPPRELVVVGLYRFSRNPMYVAVLSILLGWTICFASAGLLGLHAGVLAAFQWRIVRGRRALAGATPWTALADYAARVPRWLV